MGLALVVGPAKAGKIARLLEGYLEAIERDPVLIVPNAVGRRADRARPARAHAARSSPARSARSTTSFASWPARRSRMRRPVAERRPARARRAPRARPDAAERPRSLGALRGLRRLAARGARRARVGPARTGAARRRPRPALRVLPRRARPARALGPRPAAPPGRRAAPHGARRLGRAARVRVRLRGPDRRGVGAARGARCARRAHRLAAVRARRARVLVAAADAGGPRRAGSGPHRGAARRVRPSTGTRRSRTSSATSSPIRPPAGPSLDGARSASSRAQAPAARSSSSRRTIRELAADGMPLEQIALVVPARRALAGAARDGARHARDPVRDRGTAQSRPDALRPGAARAASLRVAAGRPP